MTHQVRCYVKSCHTVSHTYQITLSHIKPLCHTSGHIVSHQVTLCHIRSCCVTSGHSMCHTRSCHVAHQALLCVTPGHAMCHMPHQIMCHTRQCYVSHQFMSCVTLGQSTLYNICMGTIMVCLKPVNPWPAHQDGPS